MVERETQFQQVALSSSHMCVPPPHTHTNKSKKISKVKKIPLKQCMSITSKWKWIVYAQSLFLPGLVRACPLCLTQVCPSGHCTGTVIIFVCWLDSFLLWHEWGVLVISQLRLPYYPSASSTDCIVWGLLLISRCRTIFHILPAYFHFSGVMWAA